MIKALKERALLITSKREKILVVSDIHLGFELELRSRGIRIPFQTPKIWRKLSKLLRENGPQKVIILGDLKHTLVGFNREETLEVRSFVERILNYDVEVFLVTGNHDGNISYMVEGLDVKIIPSKGFTLTLGSTSIGFFHGHALPADKVLCANVLVMGHVHPMVELINDTGFSFREPVWVKLNIKKIERKYNKLPQELFSKICWELKSKVLIIMPAFNEFVGGIPLNKFLIGQRISPFLNLIWDEIKNSEIYSIDGVFLGFLKDLMFEKVHILKNWQP